MILGEGEGWRIEQPKEDDFDWRVYHTKLRLIDDYQVQAGYAGAGFVADGVPICATLELLLDVPGVTWAQVTAHAFSVRKSPTFTWEEVHVKHLVPLMIGAAEAIAYLPSD